MSRARHWCVAAGRPTYPPPHTWTQSQLQLERDSTAGMTFPDLSSHHSGGVHPAVSDALELWTTFLRLEINIMLDINIMFYVYKRNRDSKLMDVFYLNMRYGYLRSRVFSGHW